MSKINKHNTNRCNEAKKSRWLAMCLVAVLAVLSACTDYSDRVRINGDFSNLRQGEFLIYSSDGALAGFDSLHIREGKFSYELPLEREATLHIIYPNFSQLTIFARGGDKIKVKGDAASLNDVTVSGSKDNEVYTDFRQDIRELSDTAVLSVAERYIRENPTLNVSRYLLQQYFIEGDKSTAKRTKALYEVLKKANPDNMQLTALASFVNQYQMLQKGKPLPSFTLKARPTKYTDNKADSLICDTCLRGKYVLMMFWASWKSNSANALANARRYRKKADMKNTVMISYSLDINEQSLRKAEERDTVTYISYCDFQSFGSPLVQRWGIRDIPFYIYADPKGKIIASGTDWSQDIEPHLKKNVE